MMLPPVKWSLRLPHYILALAGDFIQLNNERTARKLTSHPRGEVVERTGQRWNVYTFFYYSLIHKFSFISQKRFRSLDYVSLQLSSTMIPRPSMIITRAQQKRARRKSLSFKTYFCHFSRPQSEIKREKILSSANSSTMTTGISSLPVHLLTSRWLNLR